MSSDRFSWFARSRPVGSSITTASPVTCFGVRRRFGSSWLWTPHGNRAESTLRENCNRDGRLGTMRRSIHAALMLTLAFAVAAVPIAPDWCAISCASAHSTSGASTRPACHRASDSGLRVGGTPIPCGGHHHGLVMFATDNPPEAVSPTVAGPVAAPTLAVAAHAYARLERTTGPPVGVPQIIPLASSSPLRL